MEWESYVQGILSEKDALDELRISTDGETIQNSFPKLIIASIRILDRILANGGRLNIFVFPEKQQMPFLFMLAKVISNLTSGKIELSYDLSQFKIGEKVKLGKAILEYQGITDNGMGQQCIKFKTSDVTVTTPIEFFPVLQHVKTSLKISKYDKYKEEKDKLLEGLKQFGADSVLLNLAAHKSHLDRSIAYISSVSITKTRLNECLINNQKIQDILYLGQTSYEGVVKNISAGQLNGNPALVLASDLFAANATAAMGHPFQSMIIDISNVHQVLSQLDALDEAIALKIPLLCITDTPDAFDLSEFQKRGFKVWRWDAVSLTPDLMSHGTFLDGRLRNCLNHSILYWYISDPVLSECMLRLSRQKHKIADQSSEIIKLYDEFVGLTLRALRETKRFGHRQTEEATRIFENCENINLSASSFVPEDMAQDLNYAAETLKSIYSNSTTLPKNEAMKEWFRKNARGRAICIIVPENEDRNRVRDYWNVFCLSNGIKCELNVYFPTEYCNTRLVRFDTTIIIGWMRKDIMRKTIFSYATQSYVVFLYECEKRWKNSEERSWAKATASSDNKNIIQETLSKTKSEISVVKWDSDHRFDSTGETEDLTELERVLKDNKYRQYTKGSDEYKAEKVKAVPVSFIGGYVSFYRPEHKVLQVTNILNRNSDKIRILKPDSLEEGDFVIVREADQDLIRDMADKALAAEGKSELREMAGKWHDAILVELALPSSSKEKAYQKLKKAGCKKSMITFNNWIDDEDMIAPQDQEDIRFIAEAFDNQTLQELQDKVYDAAKEVRAAHTQAGMQLSKLLQEKIAQELKEEKITDIYNIWEPITLQVEGVGNVKLLKVIDVESEVEIESSMTNRLLSD